MLFAVRGSCSKVANLGFPTSWVNISWSSHLPLIFSPTDGLNLPFRFKKSTNTKVVTKVGPCPRLLGQCQLDFASKFTNVSSLKHPLHTSPPPIKSCVCMIYWSPYCGMPFTMSVSQSPCQHGTALCSRSSSLNEMVCSFCPCGAWSACKAAAFYPCTNCVRTEPCHSHSGLRNLQVERFFSVNLSPLATDNTEKVLRPWWQAL